VADIVMDCTDGTAEGKADHADPESKRRDWLARKLAYLAHVRQESDAGMAVGVFPRLLL